MKYTAYEASSAQKRLYLINRLQGASILYNMPFCWIVKGKLDPGRLETAVKKVIHRHDALRTCFAAKDGDVFQNVYGPLEFRLEYSEIEENCPKNIDPVFNDFVKPFDLDVVPLWRMRLLGWEPGKQLLLFDIHHIICDGISIEILMRDLMIYYSGGELPEMAYQYVDFTAWQNEQWKNRRIERQEQYWLNVFGGDIPVLDFPTDYPRPMEPDIAGAGIKYEIGEELTQKLNRLASENNTTLYVVLLATYYVLLSRYTNQEDIVVGSAASGRPRLEFENVIGMFINTLALRNRVPPDKTFKAFLKEVSKNTFIGYDNQDYPFEMLVEKVAPQRHPNRNPLFDTLLVLQNFFRQIEISDPDADTGGMILTPYYYNARVAKFDLNLDVSEEERNIVIFLEYRTALFRSDTMQRFIGHFINIIREVVSDCHLRLSEIRVISEAEQEYLIDKLNDTAAGYPTEKTIDRLFAEQAGKTPDGVSVVGSWQLAVGKEERIEKAVQLTYMELNRRSERLACLLKEKGVLADDIVAIMMERSIEMIIGIIGILKAGGAYLPIDPGYPDERKRYMLTDSGAKILLTNLSAGHHFHHSSNQFITHHSGNLAYVIYTSGTTGRPKGVIIEHGNVVRLFFNDRNLFDFSDNDVWTLFHSYCFDFSVWEMYGALLYGGKLIVIPWMTARDPRQFLVLLKKEQVTVLNQTPGAFYHLSGEALSGAPQLSSIRYVIFGGETLKPAKLKPWKSRYPGTRFINMYGITETTVHVTCKEITGKEIDGDISNIGGPIPTLSTYVLNRYMTLVPVGVPGEVYVGGEGVGRGYLNRPELTAGKFVENPYKPGERLYRSGDVVRIRENGDMEYLGRMDHQVKLRGFRIELGEIENQLKNHPWVKEALVLLLADGGGDNRLCAYTVGEPAPAVKELREFLSGRLPGYMIPSYFVVLDKLPLTANGKIDRKALPGPEAGSGSEYIAPRDEIEKKLADIWKKVLGLGDDTSIGIEDNFFDLGGHSLKATMLAARIHKELGMEIPLAEIFKHPTIRGLSKNIPGTGRSRYTAPGPAEKREYYPLSSLQKRFYILNRMKGVGTSYNIANVMTVEGMLNVSRLEEAFQLLIRHHESLRTCFELKDGEVVQRIRPAVEIDCPVEFQEKCESESFSEEEIQKLIQAFIRPFDLSRAPLLRVKVVKLPYRDHLLFFDMHHIIADGTSMGILVRGLVSFYQGKWLPSLRLDYKDFALWQNSREGESVIKRQEDYWLEIFKEEIAPLALFTDYERPAAQSFAGEAMYFTLEKEIKEKIDRLKRETGATLYMILLAVYNILLSRYSGQEDIVVGTPVAGRPHPDFENIIGLFINALAMRNFPGAEKTFRQFLNEVKENTLRAFQNQQYPFGRLIEKLGRMKELNRNPLFDVELAVQNMEVPEFRLEGLRLAPYEPYASRVSQVDVALYAAEDESGDIIHGAVLYCSALFKRETIERFTGSFKAVLSAVLANRDLRIRDIHIAHDFAAVESNAYGDESVDFDF